MKTEYQDTPNCTKYLSTEKKVKENFFKNNDLFLYLWPRWALVAALRLSLVAVS